jgi:hypothetical protein
MEQISGFCLWVSSPFCLVFGLHCSCRIEFCAWFIFFSCAHQFPKPIWSRQNSPRPDLIGLCFPLLSFQAIFPVHTGSMPFSSISAQARDSADSCSHGRIPGPVFILPLCRSSFPAQVPRRGHVQALDFPRQNVVHAARSISQLHFAADFSFGLRFRSALIFLQFLPLPSHFLSSLFIAGFGHPRSSPARALLK